MRTAIVAAVLFLASATARAEERVGYVDQARAINECAEGKKVIAELAADREAHEKTRTAPAKKLNIRTDADDTFATGEQQKAAAAEQGIRARLRRVAETVRKAKKLSAIRDASGTVALDPTLDLTAEVIRRLDAGEGKTEADSKDEENAKLKAEIARLQEQVKTAKPDSWSVPPPPTKKK